MKNAGPASSPGWSGPSGSVVSTDPSGRSTAAISPMAAPARVSTSWSVSPSWTNSRHSSWSSVWWAASKTSATCAVSGSLMTTASGWSGGRRT